MNLKKLYLINSKFTCLKGLPETVKNSYKEYKKALETLTAIYKEIGFAIEAYKEEGKRNEDEIYYVRIQNNLIRLFKNPEIKKDLMAFVVKSIALLPRRLIDLELSSELVMRKKDFNRQLMMFENDRQSITLFPDDFSNVFMSFIPYLLDDILNAVSGPFDFDKINNILSKKKLDRIDNDCIHVGFGKDGATTYFSNQNIATPTRRTSRFDQNQILDHFIDLYLEKSKFPESIRPNLKALLSTLPTQGMLGFILCGSLGSYISSHGSRIANFGQGYLPHFSFDEKYQIKIQILADQNSYNYEAGNMNDVKMLMKVEFIINVNVVIDNVFEFTLGDMQVACHLNAAKDNPFVIDKEALKNPNNLPSEYADIFPACMRYLSKYLGFNSLEELYISKNGTAFDPTLFFFSFIQMTSKPPGKHLNETELNFLDWMEREYKEKKINAVGVSDAICSFVTEQIKSDLTKADKLSYIYWLQFARELKGSNNLKDKINDTYQLLIRQFSQEDISLLSKAAEKDPEFYRTMIQPTSIFAKKINLPAEWHAKILGRYPSLLQNEGNIYYVQFLENLKPQAKLLFLIKFSENGGDVAYLKNFTPKFFDEASIKVLSNFVYRYNKKSFKYFDRLVTRAPAETVAYLREEMLGEVFAAYQENLLNRPIDDLLQFLLDIDDPKLVQRFGVMFVESLILKMHQLISSDDPREVGLVIGLVTRLGEMLSGEVEFLINKGGEQLFFALDVVYQGAVTRLHALVPEGNEQLNYVEDVPESALKTSPKKPSKSRQMFFHTAKSRSIQELQQLTNYDEARKKVKKETAHPNFAIKHQNNLTYFFKQVDNTQAYLEGHLNYRYRRILPGKVAPNKIYMDRHGKPVGVKSKGIPDFKTLGDIEDEYIVEAGDAKKGLENFNAWFKGYLAQPKVFCNFMEILAASYNRWEDDLHRYNIHVNVETGEFILFDTGNSMWPDTYKIIGGRFGVDVPTNRNPEVDFNFAEDSERQFPRLIKGPHYFPGIYPHYLANFVTKPIVEFYSDNTFTDEFINIIQQLGNEEVPDFLQTPEFLEFIKQTGRTYQQIKFMINMRVKLNDLLYDEGFSYAAAALYIPRGAEHKGENVLKQMTHAESKKNMQFSQITYMPEFHTFLEQEESENHPALYQVLLNCLWHNQKLEKGMQKYPERASEFKAAIYPLENLIIKYNDLIQRTNHVNLPQKRKEIKLIDPTWYLDQISNNLKRDMIANKKEYDNFFNRNKRQFVNDESARKKQQVK